MARSNASTLRARGAPGRRLLALLFAYVCIGAAFVVMLMRPASQPAPDEAPDAAHLVDPCQAEGSLLPSRHLSQGDFRKKHGVPTRSHWELAALTQLGPARAHSLPRQSARPKAPLYTGSPSKLQTCLFLNGLRAAATTLALQCSMRTIARQCGRRWLLSLAPPSDSCSLVAGRRMHRSRGTQLDKRLGFRRVLMWCWRCSAAPIGAALQPFIAPSHLLHQRVFFAVADPRTTARCTSAHTGPTHAALDEPVPFAAGCLSFRQSPSSGEVPLLWPSTSPPQRDQSRPGYAAHGCSNTFSSTPCATCLRTQSRCCTRTVRCPTCTAT